MYNFDLRSLFFVALCVGFIVWGSWELVDWLWVDDILKSSYPITPEIELIVKDNKIDTLYIYKK